MLEDILYGRDQEPDKEPDHEMQPAPGGHDEIDEIESEHAEQVPQDRYWLDEEIERQQSQQLPDAAYEVSERDEPAPEVQPEQEQAPEPMPEPLPEHEAEGLSPATGEFTPGQSDIQHDGLQQDGSMDRETTSDGLELEQGGEMEIEM